MAFWCYSFWNASSAEEEGGLGLLFCAFWQRMQSILANTLKTSLSRLPSSAQIDKEKICSGAAARPTLKESWISRFNKQAKYFIHTVKSYDVCPCRLMQIRRLRGKEGHLLQLTWARALCILDELWGGFHFTADCRYLVEKIPEE